ncbi:hypothetical protein OS493_026912 [Desmophyllum pertusum]|uniref:Uncharacterized protein n=1 Tax=Desmophyllum pertusum TaxID=174260 RepID=A0A9W9YXC1_9CNID|nr:hypothetical protein OS493_026912 [Desmophyllum pertusum]
MNEFLDAKEQETLSNLSRLPNGRFPCRLQGCDKTFKYFGKHKEKHELQVHGLDPESEILKDVSPAVTKPEVKDEDDVFQLSMQSS